MGRVVEGLRMCRIREWRCLCAFACRLTRLPILQGMAGICTPSPQEHASRRDQELSQTDGEPTARRHTLHPAAEHTLSAHPCSDCDSGRACR